MVDKRHHEPWAHWYDRVVWKRRAADQLRREPFCRNCAAQGEYVVASVVDHIVPHRGDWNKFRLSPVQSLCKPCHDGAKRYVELHGFDNRIGVDGLPTDKAHPFYKASC